MHSEHDEAFCEAVRAAPDDDLPRLVYADYLEEAGDPLRLARAEFIRLQCALAKLPATTPEAATMTQRAAELLKAHSRRWNGPIHRRLHAGSLRGQVKARRSLVRGWRYERGFAADVTAHATAILAHPSELARIGPLTTYRVWGVWHQANQLVASPLLQQARLIVILDANLDDSDLAAFAASPLAARLRRPGERPPAQAAPPVTAPLVPLTPGVLARLRAWWYGTG